MRDVLVKVLSDRISEYFTKRFNKSYVKSEIVDRSDNIIQIKIRCADELIFSVLSEKIKEIVSDMQSVIQKMFDYSLIQYIPIQLHADEEDNIIYITIGE